jgi:polyhydroxyalkanoate synthesis regulator phasin
MATSSVQTRRSARHRSRRPPARRRKALARHGRAPWIGLRALAAPRIAPRSELAKLKDNIDTLAGAVGQVQSHVHQLQGLIREAKSLLGLPKKVADNLKKVSTVLGVVQTIASVLALVPGPIGTAGSSMRNALRPLIGPPGSGSLGAARKSALDIDKALKPVRTTVDQVGKAVGKVGAKIDSVASDVALLQGLVDNLIRRYGAHPPEGVEACCRKLNDAISGVAAEVERAADELKKRFEPVRRALQSLIDGLKPLAKVISQITALLDVLDREPFRSALRVMSQVRDAVQKLYDRVSKFVFKKLIGPLLKSLGINAKRVRAFFDGLLKKLDPMRLIKPWLDQAKREIARAVQKMAVVRAVRALLEKLTEQLAQLERAVLAFLNSACRKVLVDEAAA